MNITIEGLDDVLEQILEELRQLNVKLDSSNGAVGWLDIPAAAAYLSTTPAALRRAESRGAIVASRSTTGRVLFSREALDRYAQGGTP